MAIPEVPSENELFELAVGTRDGCRRFLGDLAESAISLLAVASFQLQGAHVGARMAAMANDGAHTDTLRAIARDYGGVSSAALNLSVRCSVTVVDLCGAVLVRLTRHHDGSQREFDAKTALEIYRRDPMPEPMPDPALLPLIELYVNKVTSVPWSNTETLRHQVTHRKYKRGHYGTTDRPSAPAPLAFPRHIDVEHGKEGLIPLDQLSRDLVEFADHTFREFCRILADLA
jgi:hypothetical protein